MQQYEIDQSKITESKPWILENFRNKPENVQFAIIGDRTGGTHVQGTYTAAMDHLNMLQQEFVINVGDMIEGYSREKDELHCNGMRRKKFAQSSRCLSFILVEITNRHIAWLTALRYAMRTKKPWEASYESMNKKVKFAYQVPEHDTPLEEEIQPYLSPTEYEQVMSADHKPNAIISLQSKHFRALTDEKKLWDFSLLYLQHILQELTALQGKSERIKNFPYPKQYASIGYHFVHIFMWLLPMAIIPAFARMGLEIAKILLWDLFCLVEHSFYGHCHLGI